MRVVAQYFITGSAVIYPLELAIVVGLSLALFVAAIGWCFDGRRVSDRPGAYFLLVSVIGIESLIVSWWLATSPASPLGDWVAGSYSGTGDLFDQTRDSGDPVRPYETERFPKPSMSADGKAWRDWQRALGDHLRNDTFQLDFEKVQRPFTTVITETLVENKELLRREFTITAADGDLIPAVALIPVEASEPLPGIIMISGHVDDDESGLVHMVLPVPSYNESAALRLAQAGFATFTLELPGFGLRGPLASLPDHHIVSYNETQNGGFYMRKVLREIKQLVDHVESLPEVDDERLGISGVSLGARLAVAYGGLDTRIKAISFHAQGGELGPHIERPGDMGQPHYCQMIPGRGRLMHQEDPFLLLAPRPTQGVRGENKPFADNTFARDLEKVWTLLGDAEAFELTVVPDGEYVYFVDEAVRFFKNHL